MFEFEVIQELKANDEILFSKTRGAKMHFDFANI